MIPVSALTVVVTVVEWAVILTGFVAAGLAGYSWLEGYDELLAIRAAKLNGALLAAAKHHLWRSTLRALPALLSVASGVHLLLLPNDVEAPSLLAKLCWLAYQVAMIANLLIERWSRAKAMR